MRAVASVGLISDTHGLLRPEALAALQGSDLIIHAGDVGSPDVLDALRALAPTFAVRGNVDAGAWAASLPAAGTGTCRSLRRRTARWPRALRRAR